MITVLLIVIAVAVLFQPNAPRFFAAAVFVLVTLSHEFVMSDVDGLAYYGSAALFDMGIIMLTSGINPIHQMVIDLQRICLASVFINLVGYFIWLAYLPPAIYDMSFMVLYTWTLLILIERNGADVGGYRMDSWYSCFRFNRPSFFGHIFGNGGQA
jgi:hypothetical protein